MYRSISAAVLVGGRSRRMGRDKATLRVGGRSLVERVVARLKPHFAEVLLVGSHPTLATLPDVMGPPCALAGIHAALSHASHPWVFVTACDMPFVSPALVGRLRRRGGPIVVPVGPSGPEPLHALYRRSCRGAIARRLRSGRLAAHEMLEALGAVRVPVAGGGPFRNVNTPADRRALGRRQAVE